MEQELKKLRAQLQVKEDVLQDAIDSEAEVSMLDGVPQIILPGEEEFHTLNDLDSNYEEFNTNQSSIPPHK